LKWKSFVKQYTVNGFNVTFDQFNVSLLNKLNIFFQQTKKKKLADPKLLLFKLINFVHLLMSHQGQARKKRRGSPKFFYSEIQRCAISQKTQLHSEQEPVI